MMAARGFGESRTGSDPPFARVRCAKDGAPAFLPIKGFFDSRSRCSRSLRMTSQCGLTYPGGLLDHAAFGIFDELHQLKNIFAELTFSFDLLQRLRGVEAG